VKTGGTSLRDLRNFQKRAQEVSKLGGRLVKKEGGQALNLTGGWLTLTGWVRIEERFHQRPQKNVETRKEPIFRGLENSKRATKRLG